MNLKDLFEKTLLPEWAIGIGAVLIFVVRGTISTASGGGILVAMGAIVYFIYKNEVPAIRIPMILVILLGVILILSNLF